MMIIFNTGTAQHYFKVYVDIEEESTFFKIMLRLNLHTLYVR